MKVLHTSDWHLGSSLHERRRYEEYEQFLDWLEETIRDEEIDILLVSGDIFDSSTPSNRSLELYYQFLTHVSAIPHLNVVITAGNHDSPSLLNAPKNLLRQLNIHVIGSIQPDVAEEVLVFPGDDGSQPLIVCAVPYLRDRDIRAAEPGESIDDKARKIQDGIREHYRKVWDVADSLKKKYGTDIPILAMGHLHLEGCTIDRNEKVRDLYIGNLAGISVDSIDCGFDYIALGHFHKPMAIGGNPWCRYCGSPLPMDFGEEARNKKVIIIDFPADGKRSTREIPIPCFQELRQITGDLPSILSELGDLCRKGRHVWVEVIVTTEFCASSTQSRIRELVDNSCVEVLKVINEPLMERALHEMEEGECLGELDETEVFVRCLDAYEIPPEERPDLVDLFREILTSVREADQFAD
jgi:exonuclease SbcD